MSEDESLTICDLAALLKVGETTSCTMAEVGDLPGLEVRGQWRFRRSDIDVWIAARSRRTKGRPEDGGGDE